VTGAKPACKNEMNSGPRTHTLSILDKKERHLLALLEEIEKNPHTSQRRLAGELDVAVGLVNALIKRIVAKGYVKIKRLNSRNIRYILTPQGMVEQSRLTFRFLRLSINHVWFYKKAVYDALLPYIDLEHNKVALYGSGEEAELAYLAIHELGMELESIVDPECEGDRCLGYSIEDHSWFSQKGRIDILLLLHSVRLRDDFQNTLHALRANPQIQKIIEITL